MIDSLGLYIWDLLLWHRINHIVFLKLFSAIHYYYINNVWWSISSISQSNLVQVISISFVWLRKKYGSFIFHVYLWKFECRYLHSRFFNCLYLKHLKCMLGLEVKKNILWGEKINDVWKFHTKIYNIIYENYYKILEAYLLIRSLKLQM